MEQASYQQTRAKLEAYFDRTAADQWAKLTSDAPVSGIRATVRAGRDRMRETLLSWLPQDLHGHRILDAGCGTGGFVARLMPDLPQWNWAGIDFMPLACRLAQARLPAAGLRAGSITQLPFPDAAFDAVTALDVISQVSYPEEVNRAFSECHRVLRSGGTLVLNVAAYRWLWSYHDEACQTRHRFAANELRRLAEAAGFDVQRLTHWNALTFPLVVARRKVFPRSAGSDVQATCFIVDRAMGGLMNLEHAWLERGGRWVWGSSLLLVAERR
jgi:magnesium protoporphyrin O-methyltransferase